MKKALTFSLLFFIILYTFGQTKSLKRSIRWENPKSVSHYYQLNQRDFNKTNFLFFENACYYNQKNFFPYYYELIKVNSPHTDVRIKNITYVKLLDKEKEIINNKNLIPEQLSYETKLNYKRKQPYLQLNLLPLRKNPLTGQIEKVKSFDIELIQKDKVIVSKQSTSFSTESVLKR